VEAINLSGKIFGDDVRVIIFVSGNLGLKESSRKRVCISKDAVSRKAHLGSHIEIE
jgi:hypothetical protein